MCWESFIKLGMGLYFYSSTGVSEFQGKIVCGGLFEADFDNGWKIFEEGFGFDEVVGSEFGDFLFEVELFAFGDFGDLDDEIAGGFGSFWGFLAEAIADGLNVIGAFAAVVVENGFGFDVTICKGARDAFGIGIIKIEDCFYNLVVSDARVFGHDFVNAGDDAFVTQKSGERGEAFHTFLGRR